MSIKVNENDSLTIKVGDCIDSMKSMEAGSVQTCVTSPPYFGLRDYGREGQIGLEETPEGYAERLVEVFREVRRVLRDDGIVWLNLGDTYASAWPCNRRNVVGSGSLENGKREARPSRLFDGLKEKDLIGIPWRVAFALQADGWYLRQDIIWHKPNPMPEGVQDRCTKSHEYVFLLSKSPKYYYNKDAISEPLKYPKENRRPLGSKGAWELDGREQRENGGGLSYEGYPSTRNKRSVWNVSVRSYKGAHFATFPPDLIEPCILAGSKPGDMVLDPFGGSGTTAGVALKHDRHATICELNPEYVDLIPDRIKNIFPDINQHTLPV